MKVNTPVGFEVVAKNENLEVDGFPGYRVDVLGRIWSCWLRGPRTRMTSQWRQLRGSTAKGRWYVWLFDATRVKIFRYVHEVVLSTFVGPRPDGYHGCHKDDNPNDNSLGNLYWGTPKSNGEDRVRNGQVPRGESHCFSTLNNEKVLEIRRRRQNGETLRSIAKRFGMGITNAHVVATRKGWKHVA